MEENVGPKPDGNVHGANAQRKLSTKGISLYHTLDLEKGASAEDVKKKYRYWYFIDLFFGFLLKHKN